MNVLYSARAACLLMMTAPLMGTVASAQDKITAYVTGNQLHKMCQENKRDAHNYVMGVFDATMVFEIASKYQYTCVPFSVNSLQLADVVCLHIDNNPAERHYQAAFLSLKALRSAWPCSAESADK